MTKYRVGDIITMSLTPPYVRRCYTGRILRKTLGGNIVINWEEGGDFVYSKAHFDYLLIQGRIKLFLPLVEKVE